MDLVKFKDEHYDLIKGWWDQYGWIAPELDVLPRTGFLAMADGTPVCAAFYYKSCSGMAYMDWVIADKSVSPLSRGKGVYTVIEAVIRDAKESKFKVLYTVTANQHLLATYEKIGLQKMESGATTMALSLTDKKIDFLRE